MPFKLSPFEIHQRLREQEKSYTLRPHLDWISLGIAMLLGLLARYVHLHIPW